ncbi:hypothetical protein BASA62_002744 [Batrachochytrium salamandrivorans]|nr:hypothetical protein BASA62_002744 [Batrachochytrium salamandrivorans]
MPPKGFQRYLTLSFKGSSPNGWTDGKATEGNNVITSTPSGKTTPSTSDGVFDTKFRAEKTPGTDDNIAAAAVNLFYVTNMMHDISYQYGFTERLETSKQTTLARAEKERVSHHKAEAGGMDEGWSDILSMIVLAKKSDTATTKSL